MGGGGGGGGGGWGGGVGGLVSCASWFDRPCLLRFLGPFLRACIQAEEEGIAHLIKSPNCAGSATSPGIWAGVK